MPPPDPPSILSANALCRRRPVALLLLLVSLLLSLLFWGCPRITVWQDPLSAREHLQLGAAYEKKGEFEAALREYHQAAREIPLAHLFLGNVYFQTRQFTQAETHYRRAIAERPDHPQAYNNLAWMFLQNRTNLQEARALAARGLELAAPDQAGTYRDTLDRIDQALRQDR